MEKINVAGSPSLVVHVVRRYSDTVRRGSSASAGKASKSYMRYRGGVDTLLNALDADRDLFAAELDLARTRRDELQAMVQLYKALGGGWQQ